MAALVLPCSHPLSLEYEREVAVEEAVAWPEAVARVGVLEKGLVEVVLRCGAQEGYGCRAWAVVVGGEGVGDDEGVDPRFGEPRSPVRLRFASPVFRHHRVDDSGVPDASFWAGLGERPTLRAVAERCVAWLEAPCGEEDRAAWAAAEAATYGKCAAIARFRKEFARSRWARTGGGLDAGACLVDAASPPVDALREIAPGVYAFPLFTADFCATLVGELDAWEASPLPRRRPNSMNRLGCVVNDCGMDALGDDLLARVVAPLAKDLYGGEVFADSLDHHHLFAVRYRVGEDEALAMHHDAAEVTLNVCLGTAFTGGDLQFCGKLGDADHRAAASAPFAHAVGTAVVHLGRHRHGVTRLEAGERVNLVLWARSSAFRAAAAFGHVAPDGFAAAANAGGDGGRVDEVCLSEPNDRDYAAQLALLRRPAASRDT